jgi:hypothetical protein
VLAASTVYNIPALTFVFAVAAACFLMGLSVSAFVLKMACRTAGAEVPDTGKAMVVSFLESLLGGLAWFLSVITVSFAGVAVQAERATISAMAGFSAIAVAFVVPAGLYVPMLRVTFQKGLVIAILRYVITLTLLAALGFALMAVTGKHRFH